MGQKQAAKRSNYPLALKVELLDIYASGEKSLAALGEERKIPAGNLYNWSVNEKAIRAAYNKELKQAEKSSNGVANHNGNGVSPHKAPSVEKELPKLQILGLTPVIEKLVKAEIDQQLPALAREAVEAFFSGKRSS